MLGVGAQSFGAHFLVVHSTWILSAALAAGKALYARLPLTQRTKRRLVELAFSAAGPLFESEVSYHLWRRARDRRVPRIEAPSLIAEDAVTAEIEALRLACSAKPTLTILITSYGNARHLVSCLKSIAAHPPNVPYEVIAVDDASGNAALVPLANVAGLAFSVNGANLGYLRTVNESARRARGEFLCLLNDDTIVTKGAFDAMLATLLERRDCAMVGPQLLLPDGRLQEAGSIVWSDGSAANYGRYGTPEDPTASYLREVDYCSAACLVVRTSEFRSVGGFDPAFTPAYREDTDLAFSLRERGGQVLFQPRAKVFHFGGASYPTKTAARLQETNLIRFRNKWTETLARQHLPPDHPSFLARDHAALKKAVLVVDRFVPEPERDAGSRSLWHILSNLVDHGLLVKLWTETPVEDRQAVDRLGQLGIEHLSAAWHDSLARWLNSNGAAIDYAFINRPGPALATIDTLREATRAPILYYGHDLHHRRLEGMAAHTNSARIAREAQQAEADERAIWEKADVVYYPSAEETAVVAAWLADKGMRTAVRTIPVFGYSGFPNAPWANADERHDLLFVANFYHPPNVPAALWLVRDVLPRVRATLPQARLWLVGAAPPGELQALAGENVIVTGQVSEDELVRNYRERRVAVAPLLFGAGMKGKVVEAMRAGLPCVTTSVGAQGLADAGTFLRVADDPQHFAAGVIHLLQDDEAWSQLSQAAQAAARVRFSAEAMWDVLRLDIDPTPYPSIEGRFRSR